MTLVFPKITRGRLLAGLMLAAVASAEAQQPARGRARNIEFIEPGTGLTSTNAAERTNLSETTPKKPAFSVLDKTVRKPFELFSAEDSFTDATVLPTRPGRPSAANSKRARELLDRKKNWGFNTPEDIYGLPTAEDMMDISEYGPNGEEKKPKTSLERFFERMEKSRTDTATNRVKDDSLPDWLKPEDDDEQESYSSGKDDKGRDRSILGVGKADAKPTSANSDFTSGLGGGTSTADKNRNEFFILGSSDSSTKPAAPDTARMERMQTFKQLLETRSSVSPGLGSGFASPLSSSPAASPLQSPFSAGTFGSDSFSPQPAPRPSSLPSIPPATTLPGTYSPGWSVPPPASVSRTFTPPPPAFQLPQRKF